MHNLFVKSSRNVLWWLAQQQPWHNLLETKTWQRYPTQFAFQSITCLESLNSIRSFCIWRLLKGRGVIDLLMVAIRLLFLLFVFFRFMKKIIELCKNIYTALFCWCHSQFSSITSQTISSALKGMKCPHQRIWASSGLDFAFWLSLPKLGHHMEMSRLWLRGDSPWHILNFIFHWILACYPPLQPGNFWFSQDMLWNSVHHNNWWLYGHCILVHMRAQSLSFLQPVNAQEDRDLATMGIASSTRNVFWDGSLSSWTLSFPSCKIGSNRIFLHR